MTVNSLKNRSVIAGVVISGAAIIVMGVMPVVASVFVSRFNLGLDLVGWVMSTESVGVACGTALAFSLIRRGRWPLTVAAAAAVAVAANLLTILAPGLPALFCLRFCSGAGAGAIYSVAIFGLAQVKDTDRVFAGVVVAQGLFFAIFAEILPLLNDRFGADAAIASIALWFVLVFVLAPLLPKGRPAGVATTDRPAVRGLLRQGGGSGLAALAGLLCFQIGIFSFWGYADELGVRRGLTPDQVASGLSIGLAVGTVAGLIPVLAGDRLGRVRMITIAGIFLLASVAGLAFFETNREYLAGVSLFNVGWPLGVTYFMALTAYHDVGGVFSRLIPMAQVLSGIVGPAIVAAIIRDDQILTANAVSAVFTVSALACAWVTSARSRSSAVGGISEADA
jgi:predicted MFS family arabinose efflux permease